MQITIPHLKLLLDAFDKLGHYRYDKELNMYAHHAGSGVAVLENRGFAWTAEDDTPGQKCEPDLVIPDGWLRVCRLRETALSALNQLTPNTSVQAA
jgi:hypothetical protein